MPSAVSLSLQDNQIGHQGAGRLAGVLPQCLALSYEDDEIHNVNDEQVEQEQLEREQNERNALDAVGDYECPSECLSRLWLWSLTSRH